MCSRQAAQRPSSPALHDYRTTLCYAKETIVITNFRHVRKRRLERIVRRVMAVMQHQREGSCAARRVASIRCWTSTMNLVGSFGVTNSTFLMVLRR